MIGRLGILLVFSLLSIQSLSQSFSDVFNLKNYQKSIILSIGEREHTTQIFSDYGTVSHSLNNGSNHNRYSFQAHEHDALLGMYLFPKRMYSNSSKRFIQPDPKSQYHSPYLFVGADPINFVDHDGNMGKPLILYGEDHLYMNHMDESILDFQSEVQDAYYYPMSAFLNGEIGDLPEWNGNLYLDGHSGTEVGSELKIEQAEEEDELMTKSSLAQKAFNEEEELFETTMDAKTFGAQVRAFADMRGVRVQNIFAAGCQGSAAAERIGQGYVQAGKGKVGATLRTMGLKKDKYAVVMGKKVAAEADVKGIDNTRYVITGKSKSITPIYRKKTVNGQRVKTTDLASIDDKDGSRVMLPYAEGPQLNDMANARVPSSIEEHVETFLHEY